MKKTDSRWDDNRITKGSSNVFLDLGFDEDEAAILKMRAEVMIRIEKRIAAKGWTQAVAAKEPWYLAAARLEDPSAVSGKTSRSIHC